MIEKIKSGLSGAVDTIDSKLKDSLSFAYPTSLPANSGDECIFNRILFIVICMVATTTAHAQKWNQ